MSTTVAWPRLEDVLLAFSIYAVLDIGAAQILKRVLPDWNPGTLARTYRVHSPLYHHDLAPSTSSTARWGGETYPFFTNSLGFRDARVRHVPARSEALRVLFLGDSFTEGIGVVYPETYVGRLASELGERHIEVLNAAVASYSPIIYARKLRYLLEDADVRVDYLVVAIDPSDVADESLEYTADSTGAVVKRYRETGRSWREILKYNSLLFRVADVTRSLLRDRVVEAERWELAALDRRSDWTFDRRAFDRYGAEGLRLATIHMDEVLALARRHDMGVAVLVYPWPAQIMAGDSASIQVEHWQNWARERQVPFFNLFPAFFADANPPQTIRRNFIPHDTHWNSEGHALVTRNLLSRGLADTISRFLRDTTAAFEAPVEVSGTR
jgi:hypothetical protein